MTLLGPTAVVVNPAAARTRRRLLERVERDLRPFGLLGVFETRGPGDEDRLAREAAEAGARVLVTLGGDGTVTQVTDAAREHDLILAPLPAGGANIFARVMGWPASPADAARALVPALAAGIVRRVTVGTVTTGGERRSFIANAGVGIDADVVEWVETRPAVKARLRQAAFGVGALAAASRAVRDAPRLAVATSAGARLTAAAVAVATGTPYTFLGPRAVRALPPASFDGVLAWLAVVRITPAAMAQLAHGALRGDLRHVDGRRMLAGAAEEVRVTADRPVAVQADGEPLGRHRAVTFASGPELAVLVPPRAAADLKSAP